MRGQRTLTRALGAYKGLGGIDHEGAAGLAMRAQFFPAFFAI